MLLRTRFASLSMLCLAAATAAPLSPFSSNSRRSKLLATWISMLGLWLATTGAIAISPPRR